MKRAIVAGLGLLVAAVVIWHPASAPNAPAAVAGNEPRAAAPRRKRRRHRGAEAGATALVYVVGAVRRPGLYRLSSGARAQAAILAAGGLSAGADPAGVNLAERVTDGEEIDAPLVGKTPHRSRRSRRSPRRHVPSPAPQSVDLNDADVATLARVPGIGPALAARIVAMRAQEGPFDTPDELLDVSGMTPAKLERARPFLRVP